MARRASDIEERVRELLARMTLDQKIGQMTQPERMHVSPDEVKRYHIGSVLSGAGSCPGENRPADWVAMTDAYRAASMEEDEDHLAIPILYGVDAVHGNANVLGATVFPHNIGLGAAGDPELVERAVLNLLHNAVKFTDEGGAIEVLCEFGDAADPAPMVWIRVRDTGIGIEPAEQSRIFQRFYRVDRARQSGGGTGLGLAVVRHIAEVHGGAVSLESAPGRGSTFGFSVPLAQHA